ncbi:hypothetical protein B0H21DRAFT_735736 [Amylocystis lapponica]|nr:hypothetical protein B0H21DRAFT_735736 [Amylocystis lapponica]
MAPTLRNRAIRNVAVPPPKRRRRTTRTFEPEPEDNVVENVVEGKLQDLPFDILFEIFLLLRPIDLLFLARTSKAFRSTLMSRKSARIWKASHSNADFLPLMDCPPLLSEPHLVDLVYGTSCYRCDASHTSNFQWFDWLARYCEDCFRHMIVKDHNRFRISCPPGRPEPMSIDYMSLLSHHSRGGPGGWHKPDYERLNAEMQGVRTGEAFYAIHRKWAERKRQCDEFERCLRSWLDRYRIERSRAYEAMKRRRLQAIVSRLNGLGYDKEIREDYRKLQSHPLVGVAEELTDTVWDDIRDPIVQLLEDQREGRRQSATVIAIKQRLRQLDTALRMAITHKKVIMPLPRSVDLVRYEEIQTIIEASKELYSSSALDKILPGLITEWQADVQSQLTDLVLSSMPVSSRNKCPNPQNLACLIFKCGCNAMLHWRDVTSHEHRSTVYIHPWRYHTIRNLSPYEIAVRGSYLDAAWDVDSFKLQVRGKRSVKVFEACGKDPATATSVEMDALDARFECVKCGTRGTRSRPTHVMNWREALLHCETKHLQTLPAELPWRQVNAGAAATT